MKALRLDKPGANPWLQCAVDHPMADPLMFLIMSTVCHLRALGSVEDTRVALSRAMQADFAGGLASISSVAISRLCKMPLAFLNVLTCSFREFTFQA